MDGAPSTLFHYPCGTYPLGQVVAEAANFRTAVELLPAATGIERLVIPTFPFSDWQTALRTVRERRGLKVAFRP